MGSMAERAQIVVRGIVQGVGFRPYVFRLAESLAIKGYVTNTDDGVLIEAEGLHLPEFVERLPREAPPLSRITDFSVTGLPCQGYSDFSIRRSVDQDHAFTLVSSDVSVCGDCLHEMLDPADRRYLYPFINCTNCGPRYSITRSVPYDRPNTTMAAFMMCPQCRKEYEDPRNRRFHAQPNACPTCGPSVEFRMNVTPPGLPLRRGGVEGSAVQNGESAAAGFGLRSDVTGSEAVEHTIKLLKQGGIVAIKGLGGFHLACDAANHDAVSRLREEKRKSNKPFAVMVPSVAAASLFCSVSESESNILASNRRPVVLLRKKENSLISNAVSPNNRFVGVMLPYTPLHYLLFYHPVPPLTATSPLRGEDMQRQAQFTALVMTSGNISEEPIVRDNEEAIKKLGHIVDGFLFHNRDIFMRVDDSVVRVRSAPDKCIRGQAPCGVRNKSKTNLTTANSELSFIRRSRGFAPDPIELRDDGPEVLACGADLKNTFTITKGRFAIPCQHIGDMENYETAQFFEESLANLKAVYRAEPKIIVHDLHPGYLSTRWAAEFGLRSAEFGVKTIGVQHHYAHIGSVMAEHGLTGKVIGVAFDGTGYGTDGNLWGAEFLIADVDGFERRAQFQYVPLPGGEAAIREPWRTGVSMVRQAAGDHAFDLLDEIGFSRRYGKQAVHQMLKIADSAELSPLASGAGRLFDAVAALVGICDTNTFEGEAAMALEALVCDGVEDQYGVELISRNGYTVVNFAPCILKLVEDVTRHLSVNTIAAKFHNTVASVISTVCCRLRDEYRLNQVALGGGTFQNLYLLDRTIKLLSSSGFAVYTNGKVPCNDGGISLGQAYLVRERLKRN